MEMKDEKRKCPFCEHLLTYVVEDGKELLKCKSREDGLPQNGWHKGWHMIRWDRAELDAINKANKEMNELEYKLLWTEPKADKK